jgi:hypothetical protein
VSILLRSPRGVRTVQRLRPGAETDLRGEAVESWDVPARAPLKGAVVETVSVTDTDGTRRVLRDERTLRFPRAVDLHAEDRVEIGAEVWRVDGEPLVRTEGLARGVETVAALVRLS